MNEVNFRYSLLRNEVEAVDLIAITTIEIFKTALYSWIWSNKSILVKNDYNDISCMEQLYSANIVEEREERYKEALQTLYEDEQSIVRALFSSDNGFYKEIGRSRSFDSYFLLDLQASTFSPSVNEFQHFILEQELANNSKLNVGVIRSRELFDAIQRCLPENIDNFVRVSTLFYL